MKTAAERLGITPSAASQAVARLETQLGQPLFERDSRPLRLTSTGRMLLLEGRPLIEAADSLKNRLTSEEIATSAALPRPMASRSVYSNFGP